MWICFGISIFAALVNLPLVFDSRFGKFITGKDEEMSHDYPIDEEMVIRRLENGEYVPIKQQYKVNEARAKSGQPFIRSKFGKYSHDSGDAFSELSVDDIMYLRDMEDLLLADINAFPEKKISYVQMLNSTHPNEEEMADIKGEIGVWLSDYLHSNGYLAGLEVGLENAQIFKSLFIKSLYFCFGNLTKMQ
jgi:hypothetical protein